MLAKFDTTPYHNLHSLSMHIMHTRWEKLSFLGKKKSQGKSMENTNPRLKTGTPFELAPLKIKVQQLPVPLADFDQISSPLMTFGNDSFLLFYDLFLSALYFHTDEFIGSYESIAIKNNCLYAESLAKPSSLKELRQILRQPFAVQCQKLNKGPR